MHDGPPDGQTAQVWEHGDYLGRVRIASEDSEGGGPWYQSAYRAAVRVFGAGSYELRRGDDKQHEGRHDSVDSMTGRVATTANSAKAIDARSSCPFGNARDGTQLLPGAIWPQFIE